MRPEIAMDAAPPINGDDRLARGLGARAWYRLCLCLGWLLRSARYSTAQVVVRSGERRVRKRRRVYAPLLVRLGGPLATLLDTGVRVLSQRDWERREREVYDRYLGVPAEVDADGTIVLPHLPGRTLAALLEDRSLDAAGKRRAIALAACALAEFHRRGLTHGDAIAGNVLVDLDTGVAAWIDFETSHDAGRSAAWRRADDMRALLATCLVRTSPDESDRTLGLILDAGADDDVVRALAASFDTIWRRSLAFHLAQAPLSIERFRIVSGAIRARLRTSGRRDATS